MTKQEVNQPVINVGEKWNVKPQGDLYMYMVEIKKVTETEVTVLPCRKGSCDTETYKLDKVAFVNKV